MNTDAAEIVSISRFKKSSRGGIEGLAAGANGVANVDWTLGRNSATRWKRFSLNSRFIFVFTSVAFTLDGSWGI